MIVNRSLYTLVICYPPHALEAHLLYFELGAIRHEWHDNCAEWRDMHLHNA